MSVQIAWGRLVQSGLYRAIRLTVLVLLSGFIIRWAGEGADLDVDVLRACWNDLWEDEGATVVLAAAGALGLRVGLDPVNGIPSLREAPIPVETKPVPVEVTTSASGHMPKSPSYTHATPSAPGYQPGTGV